MAGRDYQGLQLMRKTDNGPGRLWRPHSETLETITEVLSEHWRAAARLHPARFWPTARRWLKADPLAPPPAEPHHFTSGGKLIR